MTLHQLEINVEVSITMRRFGQRAARDNPSCNIQSLIDIARYPKIDVALSETIRIMKEIDIAIDQLGAWPAAFQSGEHP